MILDPCFREGKSVSGHTQCSPVPRLLYVYPMQVGVMSSWSRVGYIQYNIFDLILSYIVLYYVCTFSFQHTVLYNILSDLFEFEV